VKAVLTREEVVWAFRYMLGRDPESEETIAAHMPFDHWSHLRSALMKSEEFINNAGYRPFPKKWVLAPVLQAQRQMWLDVSDRGVSVHCLADVYEPFETEFLRERLRPGHGFVDIGANLGWHTLVASTLLGRADPIVAFEPRPETSGWLRRTLEANGLADQVIVHSCALGATPHRAFLNTGVGSDNPGGSFLSETRPGGNLQSAPVRVETLDSFALARVDVVKLDVEGAEPQVIEGARGTLARSRPTILSELHPRQLQAVSGVSAGDYIALMKSLGYQTQIVGPVRTGEVIEDFPADWHGELMSVGMTANG
jgi:FkbM family methyltransferase